MGDVTPLEQQTTIVKASDIEAELLKDVNKVTSDMVLSVTKSYQMALDAFKAKQHLLKSGRSKIRLLNLLMEYPLQPEKLKAHTAAEKEVFLVANQVLECKYLLLMYSYYSGMDEMLKVATPDESMMTDTVKPTEGENNV